MALTSVKSATTRSRTTKTSRTKKRIKGNSLFKLNIFKLLVHLLFFIILVLIIPSPQGFYMVNIYKALGIFLWLILSWGVILYKVSRDSKSGLFVFKHWGNRLIKLVGILTTILVILSAMVSRSAGSFLLFTSVFGNNGFMLSVNIVFIILSIAVYFTLKQLGYVFQQNLKSILIYIPFWVVVQDIINFGMIWAILKLLGTNVQDSNSIILSLLLSTYNTFASTLLFNLFVHILAVIIILFFIVYRQDSRVWANVRNWMLFIILSITLGLLTHVNKVVLVRLVVILVFTILAGLVVIYLTAKEKGDKPAFSKLLYVLGLLGGLLALTFGSNVMFKNILTIENNNSIILSDLKNSVYLLNLKDSIASFNLLQGYNSWFKYLIGGGLGSFWELWRVSAYNLRLVFLNNTILQWFFELGILGGLLWLGLIAYIGYLLFTLKNRYRAIFEVILYIFLGLWILFMPMSSLVLLMLFIIFAVIYDVVETDEKNVNKMEMVQVVRYDSDLKVKSSPLWGIVIPFLLVWFLLTYGSYKYAYYWGKVTNIDKELGAELSKEKPDAKVIEIMNNKIKYATLAQKYGFSYYKYNNLEIIKANTALSMINFVSTHEDLFNKTKPTLFVIKALQMVPDLNKVGNSNSFEVIGDIYTTAYYSGFQDDQILNQAYSYYQLAKQSKASNLSAREKLINLLMQNAKSEDELKLALFLINEIRNIGGPRYKYYDVYKEAVLLANLDQKDKALSVLEDYKNYVNSLDKVKDEDKQNEIKKIDDLISKIKELPEKSDKQGEANKESQTVKTTPTSKPQVSVTPTTE